jgi:predicted DCC family thiol-disulfide oxidoreductase YuxK
LGRSAPSLALYSDDGNGGSEIGSHTNVRYELYYDGWCPICRGAKERLAALDWQGRLTFLSMRVPGVAERLGVRTQDLAARMHVRSVRTGQLWAGIAAVRVVAGALPPLWPLFPAIWLSERLGLGGWLYDWIASRRPIIPVGHCTDQACSIHGPNEGPPG